jgi:hypothetical protein
VSPGFSARRSPPAQPSGRHVGSARLPPRPAPARTRACARPSTPMVWWQGAGRAGTKEQVSARRRGLGRSALQLLWLSPGTPCCSRP